MNNTICMSTVYPKYLKMYMYTKCVYQKITVHCLCSWENSFGLGTHGNGEELLPISVVFQSPFRNPLSLLGFICGWFSSSLFHSYAKPTLQSAKVIVVMRNKKLYSSRCKQWFYLCSTKMKGKSIILIFFRLVQ